MPAPQSAVALVGTLSVLVPMAGLIDAAAEAERLGKLLAKAQGDLQKIRTRLANDNFVRGAPPQVVAGERERVAELERTTNSLSAQLERVRGLPERGARQRECRGARARARSFETIILGKPAQIFVRRVPAGARSPAHRGRSRRGQTRWRTRSRTCGACSGSAVHQRSLPADIVGVSVFDRASQRHSVSRPPSCCSPPR
jgi:hypothetical protein